MAKQQNAATNESEPSPPDEMESLREQLSMAKADADKLRNDLDISQLENELLFGIANASKALRVAMAAGVNIAYIAQDLDKKLKAL